VIKTALAQLQIWQRRFGADFTMSINLSAVQLNQQDVAALFTNAVRSLGIRPDTLKVEITESVLAQNSDRVLGALRELHAAGIGLALDDFGTGYSSLTYLQQFPLDSVKIDTSFVKEIGRRRRDDAIVKGIVQLSHSLGLTVVAEGVETDEQLAFLRAVGCDLAQGYRVSPALPPHEFERFLIEHRGTAAHSASAP
jgi:diguanylate cyclase